jgi:Fur family ferric uptake transcriptional regulator
MIATTQTNHPLHGGETPILPKERVEAACARLRSSALRITQPRIAILKVLIGNDAPISIEQIHADLHNKSCDLVTVYRCLAAFEEIGLVRRSFFHNGTSLYQMSDQKQAAYHLVAKDTGEISPLDTIASNELATAIGKVEELLKAQGYSEVSHIVEFFAKSSAQVVTKRGRNAHVVIPAAL